MRTPLSVSRTATTRCSTAASARGSALFSSSATRRRLRLSDPVPSDLAIAQSVAPLPIGEIAAAAGLLPQELF
eukprot:COSAG03_NODE_9951_length_682_cov_1.293310_1_plen_72_part_01